MSEPAPKPPPRFIEWNGDQQIPGPYEFKDVRLWGFPLEASFQSLKTLVDRFLNIAPPEVLGFEYRPWEFLRTDLGLAYMMVLDYRYMASQTSPWSEQGYLTQHEFYFTIPVHRFENGQWSRWALFTPYIYVDSGWSATCGNLVLGYPKALGWFSLGDETTDPYPIRVSTQAFPVYSPRTPLSWEPLIDIERDPAAPPVDPPSLELPSLELPSPVLPSELEPPALWPLGALETLFGADGPFALAEDVFNEVLERGGPSFYDTVELKQVRDAVDPRVASYQALVQWSVQLTGISGGGLLAPSSAKLHAWASCPIAEALGLRQVGGRLHSPAPYWVSCDFNFVQPVNLYQTSNV